jgi:serine/threonine protein kinase
MSATAWPGGSTARAASDALDAVLDEFDARWDAGEAPHAEEYLDRIGDEGDQAALVFHELTRRRLDGSVTDIDAFLSRFPRHAERLRRILSLEDAFGPALEEAGRWLGDGPFPEPGERSGPYRLVGVLGSGRFARVYLARHEGLSGRPVVVKLSRRESPEPEWLARLRHPHVVDILAQGLTEDARFQRIVMPYLGAATLARVLALGGRLAHGRDWLERLDRVSGESAPASTSWRRALGRLDRTRAAAWVVARLAEGLEAAHRRGVAHGDLKPSNVLLAADGRPLLFDFNLAGELDALDVERGGTLDYLAPERLRHYAAGVCEAPDAARPDPLGRRRADLYSLGLILLEILNGAAPEPPAPHEDQAVRAARLVAERHDPRALRRRLAAARVPVGLRAVLARSLAPEPEDRYSRAMHLAEDLDSYVEDRRPPHAVPVGLGSRLAAAAARRRRPLAAAALALAAAGAIGWVSADRVAAERRDRAIARLADFWSGRQPDVFRFQWSGRWQRVEPGEAIKLARRVLDSHGVLKPGDWRDRVEVAALPRRERSDLELWLLEHAWRLADSLAARGGPNDLREALAVLERDPEWSRLGPIRERRHALRVRLGMPAARDGPGVDEVAAAAYVRGLEQEANHARRALGLFVLAGARAEGSFWADYRAAAAAYRVALYREASARLDRCLARYPRNAAILVQQAACQYRLGRLDEAERSCERALAIDPELAEAYRTRAFVRARRAQRLSTATDRERFAEAVGRTGRLASHELDWLTAILEDPKGPWPGEGEDLVARFRSDSVDDAELYVLQGILHERAGRLVRAHEAYEAAVAANPEHLYARLALATARFQWAQTLNHLTRRMGRATRSPVPRTVPWELSPEVLEPFVRIVEHPRYEELVAQRPEALGCLSFAWHALGRADREEHAEGRMRAGLELAARLASLDPGPHAGRFLRQLRVRLHYGLARLLIQRAGASGGTDPLDRAARELRQAARLEPARVSRWLEGDASFGPRRRELLELLGKPTH